MYIRTNKIVFNCSAALGLGHLIVGHSRLEESCFSDVIVLQKLLFPTDIANPMGIISTNWFIYYCFVSLCSLCLLLVISVHLAFSGQLLNLYVVYLF